MRAPDSDSMVQTAPFGGTGPSRRSRSPRRPNADYVRWLERRSMLYHADALSDHVAGRQLQWRNAFAQPRPNHLNQIASVWFTSYPKSLITRPSKSVLQTLANDDLLSAFSEIGIDGFHTGPMKRAGGIAGRRYRPTTDGFFDRIELKMDPLFGSDQQYIQFTRSAREHGIAIIGDIVPAHTGKGADFRLAELAYKNYEGLYTMVPIPPEDWVLLPPVPAGADCVNLSEEVVQLLEDRGYIPGPTEIIPFYDPGIKDTCWSTTDVVRGVDGVDRRWVYLHIFKASQPSLNWLDPTFGAQRIVLADVIQSLYLWGDTALRLDANPLLGIEGRPGKDASWVEGHPVAVGGSNMIAMMIRKLGGFSFQELNLSLNELKEFTRWGPDLSYDFFTRPAYLHAIATGDAAPLRLILRVILEEGLDLSLFVHALQNHDELMFDLNHFRTHGEREFLVDGTPMTGRTIYESMYAQTRAVVIGDGNRHVREFSNLGFCATMASYVASALGVADPHQITAAEKDQVQRLHLLAAAFNAMQPGVFALSGWDLVGALTISAEQLGAWLTDGDDRWLNRGAFDLMGVDPAATASHGGLPRAAALYGTLPEQLRDPGSFASQLKRLLRARKLSGLAQARLVSTAEVRRPGLVATLYEAASGSEWMVTALNFGREPLQEAVSFPVLAGLAVEQLYSLGGQPSTHAPLFDQGSLTLEMPPLEAQVFRLRPPRA